MDDRDIGGKVVMPQSSVTLDQTRIAATTLAQLVSVFP